MPFRSHSLSRYAWIQFFFRICCVFHRLCCYSIFFLFSLPFVFCILYTHRIYIKLVYRCVDRFYIPLTLYMLFHLRSHIIYLYMYGMYMYIEDGFLYKINIWYTEQSLTNVDSWVRWIVHFISCWIFILINIFRAFSGEWSRHDFIGKQILTLHAMTLSDRHLLFGTSTYKKHFYTYFGIWPIR